MSDINFSLNGKKYIVTGVDLPPDWDENKVRTWASENINELMPLAREENAAPADCQVPAAARIKAAFAPTAQGELATLNEGSDYPVHISPVSGRAAVIGGSEVEQPDEMGTRLAAFGPIGAAATREGAIDTAEAIPDAIRMTGQGAGTIAGAAGGAALTGGNLMGAYAGSVAGASAGSALGEALVQGVGSIIGTKNPLNPKKIGKEAVSGGVSQAVVGGASAGVGAMSKFMKNIINSGDSKLADLYQKIMFGVPDSASKTNIRLKFQNINKANFDERTGIELGNQLFKHLQKAKTVAQSSANMLEAQAATTKLPSDQLYAGLLSAKRLMKFKNIALRSANNPDARKFIVDRILTPLSQLERMIRASARTVTTGTGLPMPVSRAPEASMQGSGIPAGVLESIIRGMDDSIAVGFKNSSTQPSAELLKEVRAILERSIPRNIQLAKKVAAQTREKYNMFSMLDEENIKTATKQSSKLKKFIAGYHGLPENEKKILQEVAPKSLLDEIDAYSAANYLKRVMPYFFRGGLIGAGVARATNSGLLGVIAGAAASSPRLVSGLMKATMAAANRGSSKAAPAKKAIEDIMERFGFQAFMSTESNEFLRSTAREDERSKLLSQQN